MYRNRKEGYELQPQHYIPTLTDEWFQFLHRSYNPNDRVTTPSNEKKKKNVKEYQVSLTYGQKILKKWSLIV